MDRCEFLRGALAAACAAPAAAAPAKPEPLRLAPGPQLFLDDYLIESSSGLTRRVCPPVREREHPVVTGPEDRCFQPYLTVVRDPETRRFRIWYGVPESSSQSHLATMESTDGIRWIRPHRVLEDPDRIQFGCAVIDEGPEFPEREKRYKFGWYHPDGGLKVAQSPDGLRWRLLAPEVVLRHDHDINSVHRDPLRGGYIAFVSTYTEDPSWRGRRRIPMQSRSADLIRWDPPHRIVTPQDGVDEGETQFYCVSAFLVRGDLSIALVKVLRDDLSADPGGPVAGIGYTTLAWSRDGKSWTRDRTAFFDRDPRSGAWDHAMSWIDCQLPVGDEVYLYYGGYRRGHKVERFTERQIGMVRIRRDRYVAREAGAGPGRLRTPLLRLPGPSLSVNVDARGGELRAQLSDAEGRVLPGFRFEDCTPVTVDSLDASLRWRRRLSAPGERPVRLELRLERARLFALGC